MSGIYLVRILRKHGNPVPYACCYLTSLSSKVFMDESVTNALKKVGEHFADFVKTLFIEGSKPITEIIP